MPSVLVVEDEFLVRMMAVDMVAAAGLEVLEAADADQALDILEQRRDIVVVFTDIDMPQGSLDGRELAECISDNWPSVRVVLTSGKTIVRDEHLSAQQHFIPKPYSSAQVHRMLKELIN